MAAGGPAERSADVTDGSQKVAGLTILFPLVATRSI